MATCSEPPRGSAGQLLFRDSIESLRLGSSVLAHAKGCVIAIALPNVVSPSQSNAKRFCTSRVQWISTDAPGSGDSFGPKVSAYGENCPPNLKFPANGELEVSRMTGVRRIVSHLAQHRDSGLAYSNALFRRYRKERQRSDRRLDATGAVPIPPIRSRRQHRGGKTESAPTEAGTAQLHGTTS
jgi:hypothetical protein